VPDSEKARSFYGELLDWEFAPGSHADGWQVVDVRPPMGLAGGSADGGRVDMCYKVDDIEAAAELVRKNGGTAGDAEHKPYGLLADCTDNQGIGFQIWHPGE
jgi:predicted enzyme related to lactoylglutathione lyase